MNYTKDESAKAISHLREILSPGDTVYTVLRHVSRSGMQREISLFIGECERIDWLVARALGDRIGKNDGIVATGCGMDMGFELVYNLGRTLWPDGFKLKKGERGRNGDTSGRETDGGYALRHRWM